MQRQLIGLMSRLSVFVVFLWPVLVSAQTAYPPVLPDRPWVFPRDTGAHPDYRTEWWYVTGWLTDPEGTERGFQVTFFRVRTLIGEDNPSRFSPSQLMIAHAAIADPARGRLMHAERAARALDPLAGAAQEQTRAWLDDWLLALTGDDEYHTRIEADEFALDLRLIAPSGPLRNGVNGWSQKAPDPRHASYYYSRPQLAVSGKLWLDGREQAVTGHAWLDHEWSSEILPEDASGWDWIGINLKNGGSLMVFQMRNHDQQALWHAGTLIEPGADDRFFAPDELRFEPVSWWTSPRSGIRFPVGWEITAGDRTFSLQALMDDQELDSRNSTGAIYWEGAVRLFEGELEVGQGYLEMTGYGTRLRM